MMISNARIVETVMARLQPIQRYTEKLNGPPNRGIIRPDHADKIPRSMSAFGATIFVKQSDNIRALSS